MNILIYEYKHYCIDDISEAFMKAGYRIDKIKLELKDNTNDESFERRLTEQIHENEYDFVFSFNYYPVISKVCNANNINYVSWVYDSPLISLYSYTVINKCNYIFIFDYGTYSELKNQGIDTVYYLPLAVNTRRLGIMKNPENMQKKHKCDVSFVGSLYSEEKQALYKRLYNGLDDYMKGYLDSLINTQYNLYGCYLLEHSIDNEKIISRLQKSINVTTNIDGVETPAYTYASYFLSRRVTQLERKNIIDELAEQNIFHLYTHYENKHPLNKGPVDYYTEMPYVFKNSKINLNITLKSIKTGIPLRVFDIMGAGGFLISNYQQDMQEYFENGTDYIMYHDIESIPELVEYYLQHEDERRNIAKNAYEKVKEYHNFNVRVNEILSIVNN